MPRLYLTPSEFSALPVGLGLQGQLSQLQSGTLDLLLMRASQRVDTYCAKRIGAPGSTTLSANANAGDTTISVASTLGIDNEAEQAVIIGTGGTQETILIKPGGVTLSQSGTTIASPYPGTLSLAHPLAFGHSSGETVVDVYQEITEAGSASISDPYTEALQMQTAQLALAHLPPTHMELTRVVFVRNYPLSKVIAVDHSYSFDVTFNSVDISDGVSIETMQGWYRFRVGTVVLREGLVRTTYTGGYSVVPDDVKEATSYYVAEQIAQMVNPLGLTQLTMGKRTQRWDTTKAKSFLAQQAEDMLCKYRRTS
jgi:hypothetical protein